MRALLSDRFCKSLVAAPPDVQKLFGKQIALLLRNLRHPSLHAKKYDEARDIWQARINDDWRFYFKIEGDVYMLEEIRSHPK